MKKHIKALERRMEYLEKRTDSSHPAFGVKSLDDVFRDEKDALNWALGRLQADPELVMEMDPETGEVITEAVESVSIGATGHWGPVHVGDRVQAKNEVAWAKIRKGEVGKVTYFDRWIGEEYPYHVTFEHGRTAAFAREEIRKVD